jgi:transposase
VFLDETGLNTKMTRLRGRAPRGQRCLGKVPQGHYKTYTAIAALRRNRLCAPLVMDGAMNAGRFIAYVERQLLPELRAGDIVICDNLSAHKSASVKRLLAGHGCKLMFLPAYSPDLNPIEGSFSKIKSHVRAAAAREHQGLLKAFRASLRGFTPQMCRNLFSHAKYATN